MPSKFKITSRLRAIQLFDPKAEAIDIVNKNSYYITALLRLQLQSGKDGNNAPTTVFGRNFYADRTVFDKEHGRYPPLGKVTNYITLFKTGKFYGSLKTITEGTVFKTVSDVAYFQDILSMSGDIVLKLNQEHLKEFSHEILFPELKRRFKSLENGL